MVSSRETYGWLCPVRIRLLLLMVSATFWSFFCAEAGAFSVSLVGEIIVGQGVEPVIDREGPRVLFEGLRELLHQTDLTVGILGCSIGSAGERRPGLEHAFRAPTALPRGLAYGGVRFVSLASPHTMDYGPESLAETLRLLAWYGVQGFGGGETLASARKPLIREFPRPGAAEAPLRVGFLAYYHGGQFFDQYADATTPGLTPAMESFWTEDVPAAKSQTDVLIVFLHWGIDPQKEVSSRQRFMVHQLVDLGADVVVGQKSHIWQGMEIYQGRPIFYSLGDLFFDNYSRQYSRIVIPQILYEGSQWRHIRLIPIWVEPEEKPFQPTVLKGTSAEETLRAFQRLSPGVPIHIEDGVGVVEPTP